MIRKYTGLLVCILLSCRTLAIVSSDTRLLADRLVQIGMEEVQVEVEENKLYLAFEDNVYRGTFRGAGKAIGMLLKDTMLHIPVCLVLLDDRIPQIAIHIPEGTLAAYREGRLNWRQLTDLLDISYDTDAAMQTLRKTNTTNRSAGKVDIVIYPEVSLNNSWLDKLYGTELNLSPAVEVALWKGAAFTGQVIFPIWNNMTGEMDYIRPGILAFRQELRLPHNLFATVNIGNFTRNRIGAEASLLYRTNNGRWAAGADVALTGASTFWLGKWEVSAWKRLSGSVLLHYNEPHYGLEFDLRALRFVYGDCGVRMDCTRHFGEVSVGLYAMYTGGLANGGFHFAIPLPGQTRGKRRAVRVRQPEYFDWEYTAQSGNEYAARRLGRTFETRPDENRSRGYYNPSFIRTHLRGMGQSVF